MLNTDNLKIVQWLKEAKKIVSSNPDIPVVFSNEEFVRYVNTKVPIAIKISPSYVNQILSYNPETSTLPASTEAQFGEQFRDWWFTVRMDQQLQLYSTMKLNDRAWGREFKVLERRFRSNWGEDKPNENPVQHDINITFTEDKD